MVLQNRAIKRQSHVCSRMYGDEAALFSTNSHVLAILNEVGALIWGLLCENKPIFATDLAHSLTQAYDVEFPKALSDISFLLEDLLSCGFISVEGLQSEPMNEATPEDGVSTLLALERKAIHLNVPFAATIETTFRCNEKCIHCYIGEPKDELNKDELTVLLSDLADAGCLFLSLTGGEFFTRPDWRDIVRFADSKEFAIDILTNGTLISDAVAKELSTLRIRRAQVTLLGAKASTHDAITRLPGSYKRSLTAIDHLISSGIKVEVSFPLMKPNFDERYDLLRLVTEHGALLLPSHMITARNNGQTDTYDLRLDDHQVELFMSDRELYGKYSGRKPFAEHAHYVGYEDLLDAPLCFSGINTCAITPTGDVLPCNQFLFPLGNVREQPFIEIWKHSPKVLQLRKFQIRDTLECGVCNKLPICSRCPGLALLEGGDILAASPENCRCANIFGNISSRKEKI